MYKHSAFIIFLSLLQACSLGNRTESPEQSARSIQNIPQISAPEIAGNSADQNEGGSSEPSTVEGKKESGSQLTIGGQKFEGDEVGPVIAGGVLLGIGAIVGVVCLTGAEYGPCPDSAPGHSEAKVLSPVPQCAPGSQAVTDDSQALLSNTAP